MWSFHENANFFCYTLPSHSMTQACFFVLKDLTQDPDFGTQWIFRLTQNFGHAISLITHPFSIKLSQNLHLTQNLGKSLHRFAEIMTKKQPYIVCSYCSKQILYKCCFKHYVNLKCLNGLHTSNRHFVNIKDFSEVNFGQVKLNLNGF